jgi:hypothetical protein
MNPTPAGGNCARFLHTLFPAGTPGYFHLWTAEDGRSHWFRADQVAEASARMAELAATMNVYFGPGLRGTDLGPNRRGGKDEVIGITSFWVDLDILDPAHKRKDLPPTIADALGLLDCVPQPTVTVHSGHGAYAFWCLKEPWIFEDDGDRARAADMVARLQATVREKAKARGWHVDSTQSLDHLLRPVGAINRKRGDDDQPLPPAPVRSL